MALHKKLVENICLLWGGMREEMLGTGGVDCSCGKEYMVVEYRALMNDVNLQVNSGDH